MIRKVTENDREIFIQLVDEFFHSPAVNHSIPIKHIEDTFNEIISDSPFIDAYLFEEDNIVVGYAQISFTYSNEAGGLVLLIEEIYLRDECRGKGIGSKFFEFILKEYDGIVARYRLEVEYDNFRAKKLYESFGFSELKYIQMIKE